MDKWVIGVDEAGRGPLAGPLAVGAVLMRKRDFNFFKGVRDSKKLSEKQREEWFSRIKRASDDGLLSFSVSLCSPSFIDKNGLTASVSKTLFRAINRLRCDREKVLVLLDGGLRAPSDFLFQRTIIGGDNKEVSIMLAALVAKVSRDRVLKKLASDFPDYGFESHKGYGTKVHREAILKYGITPLHRASFLKNFLQK